MAMPPEYWLEMGAGLGGGGHSGLGASIGGIPVFKGLSFELIDDLNHLMDLLRQITTAESEYGLAFPGGSLIFGQNSQISNNTKSSSTKGGTPQ
jgi:hypothetical protein